MGSGTHNIPNATPDTPGEDVTVRYLNDGLSMATDYGTGYGIAQNRVDDGIVATRRTMVWPSGEGPTKIKCRYESVTSGQTLYIVINAISDTHADAELADPISQDSTTERYTLFDTAISPDGIEIASITPIDRLDYLLSSADDSSFLFVEGA